LKKIVSHSGIHLLGFFADLKKKLGGLAIFFTETETNTNPGDDVGIGNALMKITGGVGGNFLRLGVEGGLWEKNRFQAKMVLEKHAISPSCVCVGC
jgi:hypothetical protein